MVTEVHRGQSGGEECRKLTSEHPTPGIVLLEQLVEPVQLRLIKLSVVDQPIFVFRQ